MKLTIPIFHVEAGNRLGTLDNPEEVNRITADHLSSLLLCATLDAKANLILEGLGERAHVVGNIMYDSFLYFIERPWQPDLRCFDGSQLPVQESYYYMTCHRQENTWSDEPLTQILSAMESLDAPVIYPVHPRNREMAQRVVASNNFKNIRLIQPVSYANSVQLTRHAKKIVTDSGGLQCEAFFAGVQCLFVFDHVAWPETMVGNRNQLAKADSADILTKLSRPQAVDPSYQPFGDGHAAEKICDVIREWNQ